MDNILQRIVFDDHLTHVEIGRAVIALEQDHWLIREFWEDDETQEIFVSGFDQYGASLIRFLQSIHDHYRPKGALEANVAVSFLQELTTPLIRDRFDDISHSVDKVADLAITTLQLFHNRGQSHFSSIRLFLELIARNPRLAQRLVADVAGHDVLCGLFHHKKSNHDHLSRIVGATAMSDFVEVLMDLSLHCKRHSISDERQRWHKLKELVKKLEEAHAKITISYKAFMQGDITKIPLKGLRRLSKDDKKSGKSHKEEKLPMIIMSDMDQLALSMFDLSVPGNAMEIVNLKKHLQERCTSTIFLNVFQTFPCDSCRSRIRYSSGDTTIVQDFSVAEHIGTQNLGVWRILMTGKALSDIGGLNDNGQLSDAQRVLKEIATGDWKNRESLARHYKNLNTTLPIFKAIYGSNGRILWNIFLAHDATRNLVSQVVKVWSIGDHKEVKKSIPVIVKAMKTYSDTIIAGCKAREFNKLRGIYIPILSGEDTLSQGRLNGLGLSREESLLLHQAMITGKTFALTQQILDSLAAGNSNIEVPFELSKAEASIVTFNDTPAFIQGRSGTGKTSCLVFRMFTRYLLRDSLALGKQVFITKSPVLSSKIREYINNLINCQLGILSKEESKSAPNNSGPVLAMDLQKLCESNLPLVCTFEELLAILTKTISTKMIESISERYSMSDTRSLAAEDLNFRRPPRPVDFETFKYEYWPLMPPQTRRAMIPDVVFSEILGVIKGSKHSIATLQNLTLEDYLGGSTRASSFFQNESERLWVYQIFQYYEKIKNSFRDWDGIDRARQILTTLRDDPGLSKVIQSLIGEIYVDEIQDIRMIEIYILFNLVHNPLAITLAGDTAQCISKDSSFRFQDVKSTFYEHFQQFAAFSGRKSSIKPTLFPLCENYRSHQGILGLASTITGYLWKLFPESVDKLPAEVGKYKGPLPIVFAGFENSSLRETSFKPIDDDGVVNTFGGHQVVLVRDSKCVELAKKVVGEDVMIQTILQSKGLEYEDVLLFDFFSHTEDQERIPLRVLASIVKNGGEAMLDKAKHAGLCSELKSLYVAVTRCQSRLWIYEEDGSAIQPFIDICTHFSDEPLIETITPWSREASDQCKEIFKDRREFDPKLWEQRGHEMLAKCEYKLALKYFSNAKSTTGKALAKAYLTRVEAISQRSTNFSTAEPKLRQAVELFVQAGAIREAAKSLEDWGLYEEAAEKYIVSGDLLHAANLYEKTNKYLIASRLYHDVGCHNDAANALQRGHLFDELIDYMSEYKSKIEPKRYQTLSRLCKVLSQRRLIANPDQVATKLVEKVETDAEKEKFCRETGLDDELVGLLLKRGEFSESWDILIRSAKFEKALTVASPSDLIEEKTERQVRKALHCSMATTFFEQIGSLETYSGGEIVFNPTWEVREHPLYQSILSNWRTLARLVERQDRKEAYNLVGRELIDDGILQELFDLLCLERTSVLLNKIEDFSKLPIDSLIALVELVKRMIRSGTIPASAQLRLGLIEMHAGDEGHENGFRLLPWSPFHKITLEHGKSYLETIQSLLIVSVVQRSFEILEKANELLPRARWICWHFAERGFCTRTGCLSEHRPFPTTEEYITDLKNLQRTTVLACSLLFFYHRYPDNFNDSEQKRFLPYVRKWLERYLAKSTFFSQSIQLPLSYLVSEKEFTLDVRLHSELEKLLFHRLMPKEGKEKEEAENERGESLSVMLDQLYLAEFLGGHTFWRFRCWVNEVQRSERRRYYNNRDRYRFLTPTFNTSLAAMQDIMMLLYRLERRGIYEPNRLSLVAQNVAKLSPSIHFRAFHSIITLYERILVELFIRFNNDDLILAWTWFHRFKLAKRTSLQTSARLPSKMLCGALVEIITSLTQVAANIQQCDIRFWFSNKPFPYSKSAMQRRIDEALLLSFTNIQCSGLANLNNVSSLKLSQAMLSWSLIPQSRYQNRRSTTSYGLLKECERVFNGYGGKEALVRLRIRLEASTRPLTELQKVLHSAGIKTQTVQLLLRQHVGSSGLHSQGLATEPPSQASEEKTLDDDGTVEEKKAVATIWDSWCRRKTGYFRNQKFKRSPTGKAVELIKELVEDHHVCPPSSQHMRFVLLVRAYGPSALVPLMEASRRLREFEDSCQKATYDIFDFQFVDNLHQKSIQGIALLEKINIFSKNQNRQPSELCSKPDIKNKLRKIKKLAQKALDGVIKWEKELKEILG